MKKSLLKDSFKEITKTYKRFISILLMAFLGVGFFAGVRATSPDMKLTIDKLLDNKNVYDINVISTLGLTEDDINEISKVQGVEQVKGIYSEDVFITFEDEESVVKVFGFDSKINEPDLLEGKLPENIDECVIEMQMKNSENISLGDYIEIRENLSEDEDSSFKNTKLKVVGTIKSPLYISRDRGTTTLGSGKISYYIYVNKENINSDIYTEIDVSVKDAKKTLALDDEYDSLISKVEDNLEGIKESRQDARYNELINEANQKLSDAQNEFDTQKADGEKQISDAEQEIANAKIKIKNSEKELEDGRNTANTEIANAENQINEAQNTLIVSQETLDDQKVYFEQKKKEAEVGKKQIQDGINSINSNIQNINTNLEMLNEIKNTNEILKSLYARLEECKKQVDGPEKEQEIAYLESQISTYEAKKQLIGGNLITEEELEKQLKALQDGLNECNKNKVSLEGQLNAINTEIANGENELNSAQNKITSAWQELNNSKSQLEQNKKDVDRKFTEAENEIKKGKTELADGEKELEEKKQEFNEKIADAESKLIDAREKVNDIEKAKWYILDRYDNSGFNSYSQDTDNVKKLGEAFPIVFFIIATLISLTSMSRMVEEQRVQIGTLKALGYNSLQIMTKYIIYSLSASLIGGILGAIFGLQFFPKVIITMYQMLYNITDIVVEFNLYYTILGIGIMSLCIVGATIYTAMKELSSTPAEMMRPKAPKAGKRVFLEKIPFIWNKLNFTKKVTIRNMFRYKKRFLMTVIGIMGCTALIVTGFGLKDSISNIMDFQYVDIYNYDMMISLKNTLTKDEISSLVNELESKEEIEKCTQIYMSSEKIKNQNIEKDVQVIVTSNVEDLDRVIKLKDIKSGEKLVLNDDTVIITDKLAQLLNVNIGDEVNLSDSENNEYKVKIGGITEHYISHYIYMTSGLYEKIFNKELNTNVLLTQYSSNLTDEIENNLSKQILSNSKIASVTLTSYLIGIMDDTLSAMNFVVYVLIVSAGLLAFIVLYNLSNINISERIRELATIKVLGFYDKEVYDYITREVVLLTIIGILFGLVFGFFLNSFILGTCEIEMLRFKRIVTIQSYLLSAIITIIFTCIVNFITFFSLKKVDMIESLKSVE